MSTSRPARVTKQKTAKQSRTTVNPVGHPSVFSAGDKLSDNLNPSSLFAQDTSRTTGGIEQPSALDFNLSSSSASDASHTSGSKDHPSALELSLSSMDDSSSMEKEVGQTSCISQQQQCSKKESEPSKATDDVVIAYVHQLSPSKRNKKDTLYYSTLLLQTSENGCQDALLYSKQKHKLLSDSQKSHTPVKIQRFTHTSDGKKLIINDITKISVPDQTEYSFQYSVDTVATSPILSVAQILNSSSDWDKVTICGKIVHMCDQELAGRNKLRLARATFADTTGTIAIDLWEENIAVIKIGTVYRIAPIQVRVWNEAKKLSTMRSSVVTPVTDTTISQLQIPEEQLKSGNETVTATVANIHTIEKVERFIACFNCAKRILQGTSSNVVHCDWCGHTMRISNCSQYVCAKLVLYVNDRQIHLTAFQDVLSNVIKGDFAKFSEAEIAEMLLLLNNITVAYNANSRVVKELKAVC